MASDFRISGVNIFEVIDDDPVGSIGAEHFASDSLFISESEEPYSGFDNEVVFAADVKVKLFSEVVYKSCIALKFGTYSECSFFGQFSRFSDEDAELIFSVESSPDGFNNSEEDGFTETSRSGDSDDLFFRVSIFDASFLECTEGFIAVVREVSFSEVIE